MLWTSNLTAGVEDMRANCSSLPNCTLFENVPLSSFHASSSTYSPTIEFKNQSSSLEDISGEKLKLALLSDMCTGTGGMKGPDTNTELRDWVTAFIDLMKIQNKTKMKGCYGRQRSKPGISPWTSNQKPWKQSKSENPGTRHRPHHKTCFLNCFEQYTRKGKTRETKRDMPKDKQGQKTNNKKIKLTTNWKQ